MRQCPKCQASIKDTAKFCPKCGVNIKQYEEENSRDCFCSECGAKLEEGDFCAECGARVNNSGASMESSDAFGDDWLSSINEMTSVEVEQEETRKRVEEEAKREAEERERQRKATEEAARQEALRQEAARRLELKKRREALFSQKFQRNGDIIIFGRYPQSYAKGITSVGADGYCTVNGRECYRVNSTREEQKIFRTVTVPVVNHYEIEPIRWKIIQETDESVFVVSEKILAERAFREDKYANRANDYINSDVRRWLNGEFLKNAFSSEEQSYILPTIIEYNSDKIFLLSYSEEKSLNDKEMTHFAKAYRKYQSYSSRDTWWLRDPYVGSDDCVKLVGILNQSLAYYNQGVVPALRIDKTKLG